MADLYQPDQVAYPDTLDAIKLLSQRDLAVRVPINYVPLPGVSVAAACTANNTFIASAFAKCISNLLVTGVRKYTLDLYWDETEDTWSFCPAQLGQPDTEAALTTSSLQSSSTGNTTALPSLSTATVLRKDLQERQQTASTRSLTSAQLSLTSSATSTSIPAYVTPASPIIRAGPYSCTTGTDFTLFMNVLVAHLQTTENNLNATTIFLTLNVNHAAKVVGNALSYGPPARFPVTDRRLSSLLWANTTSYTYQPSELLDQRVNLNATDSWYGPRDYLAPDSGYFAVVDKGSYDTTPDGWPSDGFVEFVKAKRLFAGFGTVSNDMIPYNISIEPFIFQPGVIERRQPYTISSSGDLSTGCYYNSGASTVAQANNTWAVGVMPNTNAPSAAQDAKALTLCGLAPVLNSTLNGSSAADSIDLYHQFVMGTIWSWAENEPRDNVNSSVDFHCAVINATSGRWQVDSCVNKHYGACRHAGPYDWSISSTYLTYDRVDQACDSDASFTAPRTALENDYLLAEWRQQRSSSGTSDELLFLNFNDIDVATCWVAGQNQTCPYQESDNNTNRIVTIPTVAAVIVFVITILTVFIKCAANRQNTRRRRRRGKDDMGDYEGVPA